MYRHDRLARCMLRSCAVVLASFWWNCPPRSGRLARKTSVQFTEFWIYYNTMFQWYCLILTITNTSYENSEYNNTILLPVFVFHLVKFIKKVVFGSSVLCVASSNSQFSVVPLHGKRPRLNIHYISRAEYKPQWPLAAPKTTYKPRLIFRKLR